MRLDHAAPRRPHRCCPARRRRPGRRVGGHHPRRAHPLRPARPRGAAVHRGRRRCAQPSPPQSIPRNPHMAPNERSNIHDDAYQTDAYNVAGPLGRDLQVTQHAVRAGVRVGHLRPGRPHRDRVRLAHRRDAAADRPRLAGDAGVVRAAAAPARHLLVQQLLRRRLLLPRRPRPCRRRHLHRTPAHARREQRRDRLHAGPRRRPQRRDAAAPASRARCPTGRGRIWFVTAVRHGRLRDPRQTRCARCTCRRARRSRTASRWTSPVASSSSRRTRSTATTSAAASRR